MFCNKSFKKWNATKTTKHKSVPWWTGELKLMRRRINALRRRYQRTTNYNGLRQRCKNQYNGGKLQYQAAIKRENSNLGKNSATSTQLRTHGTPFTNLPRTKQIEANP